MVRDKRLEFVNGGMVASDEACPLYTDLIENLRMGNNFLKREFNLTMRIGWHADAFGHSMATNALFQEMGYEALFFGRINDLDKEQRKKNREMEFLWEPTFETEGGPKPFGKSLFTHVMYRSYSSPCNIKMPDSWDRRSINSFAKDQKDNVKREGENLINCLNEYADSYQSKHLMWALGEDFSFYRPDVNYDIMDYLITWVSQRTDRFTFVYSTVGNFHSSVLQDISERDITLPLYTEDFLPLQMQVPNGFWSGYYTSRPNFKKLIRDYIGLTSTSTTMYSLDMFRPDNDLFFEEDAKV